MHHQVFGERPARTFVEIFRVAGRCICVYEVAVNVLRSQS